MAFGWKRKPGATQNDDTEPSLNLIFTAILVATYVFAAMQGYIIHLLSSNGELLWAAAFAAVAAFGSITTTIIIWNAIKERRQ